MKRIISIFLALLVLLNGTYSAPSYALTDAPSSWAKEAVDELKATGLFEDARFVNYEKPMTRQQFVYFLVESYETMTGKEITIDYSIRFNDTSDEYALKAATVGLTNGTAPGYFSPNDTLDRKTMVAFIVKLLQKGNMELKPASTDKFADDAKIPSWAKDYIMISKANNIVSGEPNGNFNPDGIATGQIAMILTNSILKESVGKTYTVGGVANVIKLDTPEAVVNTAPKTASGYTELKTASTLSSASLNNTVTLAINKGDSLESVGLYKGKEAVVADITIKGSTVTITTDKLLPLDTTFTIKAFASSGTRYSMAINTPKYQKFDLEKMKTTAYSSVEIPANPAKGFYYSYFITISGRTLNTGKAPYELLVETNNTGSVSSSEILFYEDTKAWSSTGSYVNWIASSINGFSLKTTFPRPEQAWETYTHALDRDSLLVTDEIIKNANMGNFKRLDLQLKAIMADAKFQLESNGLKMNGLPMLHGFSASSDFANRYSILHPETIKAVGISHGTTMPLTTYNGVTLNYPMGVADIKTLTGITFNDKAYKALPQFWFRGDLDNNDGSYLYDGWDTMGESYRKAFGEDIKVRKTNQVALLKKAGYANIVFKEYKGIGHDYNQAILDDLVKFYNSVK